MGISDLFWGDICKTGALNIRILNEEISICQWTKNRTLIITGVVPDTYFSCSTVPSGKAVKKIRHIIYPLYCPKEFRIKYE